MMNRSKPFITVIVMVMLFTHCDLSVSNDPPDERHGWFEMSVGGAFNENFSGAVIFGFFNHPETGERGIVLHFVSQVPVAQMIGKLDEPETGIEYDIIQFREGKDYITYTGENEFIAAFFNHVRIDYSDRFYSRTGDVFFEQLEDNILSGSFSFIATGFHEDAPGDTVELFISGHFEALEGEIEL